MILYIILCKIIFKDTDEKSKEIPANIEKSNEIKSEESTTPIVVKEENELSTKADNEEETKV